MLVVPLLQDPEFQRFFNGFQILEVTATMASEFFSLPLDPEFQGAFNGLRRALAGRAITMARISWVFPLLVGPLLQDPKFEEFFILFERTLRG